MSTFKTFSQVESEFLNEEIRKNSLRNQGKILEKFAELLSENNITNANQLTTEVAIELVDRINESFIELDTVDPDEKKLKSFVGSNDIEMEVLKDEGPSGYPIVRYTGRRSVLKKLYLKFWDEMGSDDFDDFLDTHYS